MATQTANDTCNTSEMPEHRAGTQVHERLTALLWEFQANRSILDELVVCYSKFRFTGGEVPRRPWRLDAVASYIEHPFAADRISTSEASHYCDLASEIMVSGQEVAKDRPRKLRQRWAMAGTFAEAAGKIRAISRDLEAGLTSLLMELDVSPSFAEKMHGFGSGEQDFWPAAPISVT